MTVLHNLSLGINEKVNTSYFIVCKPIAFAKVLILSDFQGQKTHLSIPVIFNFDDFTIFLGNVCKSQVI